MQGRLQDRGWLLLSRFSLEYPRRPTSRIGIVSRIERILTVRVLPTGNYAVSGVIYRGSDTSALFFVISWRFIGCERGWRRTWETALIKSEKPLITASWFSIQRWGTDIITCSKNRRLFIKIQVSFSRETTDGCVGLFFVRVAAEIAGRRKKCLMRLFVLRLHSKMTPGSGSWFGTEL